MRNLSNIRKDLHQIPELAFEEFKTQEYLLDLLRAYPELNIHLFKPTGFLVEYKPVSSSFLLFRSDMDALPITEKTGVHYTSRHPGKMHACGHDIHMTVLIGLIQKVLQQKPKQNILFLFQPAEEGQAGAKTILTDPIWDRYHIHSVYGLHVSPELYPGEISSRKGNFFSATCEFDVTIKGKSAHIANPESGKNALEAGIEVYQSVKQLPHIVQSDENFICDFGKMTAGTIRNAIPEHCQLFGTMRAVDQNSINDLKESLTAVCNTIATAYGVKVQTQFLAEYRQVTNNAQLVDKLSLVAKQLNLSYSTASRTSAGEDFGFYTELWQGLFFWLGAREKEFYPLHSDKFLPSDSAIEIGVNIFYQLILDHIGT